MAWTNARWMNDVSGKFTTSTDKQEGDVSVCVCVCDCILIGSTEHDEVTA